MGLHSPLQHGHAMAKVLGALFVSRTSFGHKIYGVELGFVLAEDGDDFIYNRLTIVIKFSKLKSYKPKKNERGRKIIQR